MSSVNGTNGQNNTAPVSEDWETEALNNLDNPDQETEGAEDSEAWGESSFEGAEGEGSASSLSPEDAKKKLEEMRQLLVDKLKTDKTLTEDQKKEIHTQIKEIERISVSGEGALDPETANQIDALSAKVYGTAADGAEGDGESMLDAQPQTKDLEQKIQALSADDKTKQDLLSRLEQAKNIQSIDTQKAGEQLDVLAQEVQSYAGYSPLAIKVAKALSLTNSEEGNLPNPEQADSLLKKHNITDPNNITDEQLQPLLNDLLKDAKENVVSAQKDLQKTWDDLGPQMDKVNSDNYGKDNSTLVNSDFSPFKVGNEIVEGSHPQVKTLKEALVNYSKEAASVLSALKGTEVTALEDKPGMISMGGKEISLMTDAQNAEVHFGDKAPELIPNFHPTPIYLGEDVDNQESLMDYRGKTPDWVFRSHYPIKTGNEGWLPMTIPGFAPGSFIPIAN